MNHPKRLIDEIAAKLAMEYPTKVGYEYVFGKQLKGTKMMPDIMVTRHGCSICVVEIGYTRPEKLTAYRDLHIPDVRWYDKQGRIHADVQEKVITIKIKAEPTRDMSIYSVKDEVSCIGCSDVDMIPVPDYCIERFIRRFGEDALEERQTEYDLNCRDDVFTDVITDHINIWLPSYCDKCGRNWLADPKDEAMFLVWQFEGTPRDVSLRMGARALMPWDQVYAMVLKDFGLSLDYLDGHFLQPEIEGSVRSEIHAEMDRARSAFIKEKSMGRK